MRYILRTNNNDNIGAIGVVIFILFSVKIIKYGFSFMFAFGGSINTERGYFLYIKKRGPFSLLCVKVYGIYCLGLYTL